MEKLTVEYMDSPVEDVPVGNMFGNMDRIEVEAVIIRYKRHLTDEEKLRLREVLSEETYKVMNGMCSDYMTLMPLKGRKLYLKHTDAGAELIYN